MALTVLLPPTTITVSAAGGDRTLYLHHTHTGQTGSFTFRKGGKYDQKVLRDLNIFLADWRTKEPTKMDPALFDLLWSVYTEVGGRQPINIVSSYRSPKTNKMLASKSSGVADNSQHMRGKAIDFFIPGVNLARLREVAMQHQVGGVGYYPTSGSPFVHLDTGNVRAWPRMTRAQLKKIFPDGRTLHLPTDGKPLSSEGRAFAQAQWTKCHAVPCDGSVRFDTNPGIMIADSGGAVAPIPATKPKDLYARSGIMLAALDEEPAFRKVATVKLPPLPLDRPDRLSAGAVPPADSKAPSGDFYAAWAEIGAPVPATKSPRLMLATRSALGAAEDGKSALAALEALEAPKARVLMTPREGEMVTAYVATSPDPGAELALKMIIERESLTAAPLPAGDMAPDPTDGIVTASLGGSDELKGMFDLTFNALLPSKKSEPIAKALAKLALERQPNPSIERRVAELVAPELDHVNETLVHPVKMSGEFWAQLTDAEGYLDKGTELGPLSGRLGIIPDDAPIAAYDRFVIDAPRLIADL